MSARSPWATTLQTSYSVTSSLRRDNCYYILLMALKFITWLVKWLFKVMKFWILNIFVVCCVLKAENELRIAQSDFDRHAEVTRLLLEGLSSSHVSTIKGWYSNVMILKRFDSSLETLQDYNQGSADLSFQVPYGKVCDSFFVRLLYSESKSWLNFNIWKTL